jgi:hypothetical protein
MKDIPEKKDTATSDIAVSVGKPTGLRKDKEKSERAFKIFDSSIKRAENLLTINISTDKKRLKIPNDKILDCYRAVIVLSISALDAYIKTFLIVEIKQRLEERNLSTDLKKYIRDELFSKETLHQCVLDNDFFEKVIEKFDDDFEKKSFQGQKSIDKYMKLAGYEQIFKMISDSADKSPNILQRDIEIFTQRRHLIVHCGDHNLSQTELTESKISKTDASECIKLVKFIATEIHKLSQIK